MGKLQMIKDWDELRRENLGFYHSRPETLHKCQWPLPTILYLIFRWVTAAYLVAMKIYTFYYGWSWGRHLIYMTNWSYLVVTISFLLQAICCTISYFNCSSAGKGAITRAGYERLPWFVRLEWMFFNVSNTAAILVSIVFWTAIYHGEGIHLVNFNTHAINSLLVLLSFSLTSLPVRLFHIYQPMIYIVLYGVFSIVYWAAGGTNPHGDHYIYKVLDYGGNTKLAVTLAVCLVCIATPVIHTLIFALYKLKTFIHRKVCSREETSNPVKLEMADYDP